MKEQGLLYVEEKREIPVKSDLVKALCLHICHDCNLSCKYCFAGKGKYKGKAEYMAVEVAKKAVDFLISNSGNTQEVVQNVMPLKANGVKTVAFTSRKESKLSQLCDFSIIYPETEEADALNLAPTSSSTIALVLGDAIACELSERKNFTPADFHKFHPNGALGAYLSKKENK